MRLPLCPALLLVAASLLPAAAQTPVPDWQPACDSEGCTLARQLVDQGTGQPMATFLAFVPKGEGAVSLGAALPLGTAIEAGIRLVAGGTTLDIPYQVCLPDGCRALRETTPAEIAALGSAESVDLRFFAFNSDAPISVTMPLAGFPDAIAAARAELGR